MDEEVSIGDFVVYLDAICRVEDIIDPVRGRNWKAAHLSTFFDEHQRPCFQREADRRFIPVAGLKKINPAYIKDRIARWNHIAREMK